MSTDFPQKISDNPSKSVTFVFHYKFYVKVSDISPMVLLSRNLSKEDPAWTQSFTKSAEEPEKHCFSQNTENQVYLGPPKETAKSILCFWLTYLSTGLFQA
jgi:hypothetical protein